MTQPAPNCKCGRPCDYYGKVGGFSVACKVCNAKNAKRQRDARAKKKISDIPKGYKERVDAAILSMMPHAKCLLDISQEFGCTEFVTTGEGITVTIRETPKQP